jgi:hypothetical protein
MSAFIIHVTFDCAEPERLADFWAQVTGYERVAESNAEVVALESPDHRGVRRILFFKVPEPKTVKNRVHVDLAAKAPDAEIERLVSLGATLVEHRHGGLGNSWTVMLDPEGNEFCIG